MSELGAYYVTIVPSLRGAARQIEAELRGVDATGAGTTIGQSVSSAVGKSLDFQVVGQRLQDIGSNVSNLGGKLTKSLTVPIVGATVAAGGLVAALGWKRLTSIDTAQGQLRGLGYETADIQKITNQLSTDLEGGMMDMGQATFAAAGAMAAGVEQGSELTRHIQTLDAAGVASTGTLEEMTELFTRVADEGTLSADVYDMLARRVTGFSSAMQESTGATGKEFRDMLNNGEISYAEFVDVMDAHAGDMATEHAKTMEGMIQNTLAWIGVVGENLLGGVFEQSKDSIQEFIDVLSSDEAAAKAQEIGAVISDVFGAIVSVVGGAISWFLNLSGGMQRVIVAALAIAAAIGPVLVVVGAVISAVGKIISIGGLLISGIRTAIGVAKAFSLVLMANPIGLVIAAVVALVAGLVWFFSQTEIGQQMWSAFIDWLVQAWGFVKEFFSALWTGISEGFIAIWEIIKNAVVTAVELIRLAIVTYITFILTFWTTVWTTIADFFTNIWNNILSFISIVVAGVRAVIQNNVQNIQNIWNTVWSAISTFFSGIWNNIRTFVTNAINTIRSTITNVINTIRGTWNSVWSGIRSFFSNIWNTIVSAARGFMSSVQGTFQNVITFVSNIPSRILGFFSNMGSLLLGAGRSLLDGFLSGIRAGFDKVRNFVSDGISSIRNFFPFSPAKEGAFSGSGYTLHSGRALMEDFAAGIGESSPAAIAAMSDAAEAIARETDLSAAIPDFLPADWTTSMVPAGVGGSPANARFAASQGATQPAGTTVQMTNEFTQSDPNEAVAIMWGTLRSAIRSNGGGDIGANPNA